MLKDGDNPKDLVHGLLNRSDEMTRTGEHIRAKVILKAALETAFIAKTIFPQDEDNSRLFRYVMSLYFKSDWEGRVKAKSTQEEWFRAWAMSEDEAKKQAKSLISTGQQKKIDPKLLKLTLYLSRQQWIQAKELSSSLLEDDPNNFTLKVMAASALFGLNEHIRRRLIEAIYENEKDPFEIEDVGTRNILLNQGLVCHGFDIIGHAFIVRSSIINYAEENKLEAAIACTARYANILQTCDDLGSEYAYWPGLKATMASTEKLNQALQKALAAQQSSSDAKQVNVSFKSGSETSLVISSPTNLIDAMAELKAALEEFKRTLIPESTVSALPKTTSKPDPKGIVMDCPICFNHIITVPKMTPGCGYMMGVACSGILTPILIGFVPFFILLATKPCHYAEHFCPNCGKQVQKL